jgi:hypothetical protein
MMSMAICTYCFDFYVFMHRLDMMFRVFSDGPSLAAGTSSRADGAASLAVGNASTAAGDASVALGKGASVGTHPDSHRARQVVHTT